MSLSFEDRAKAMIPAPIYYTYKIAKEARRSEPELLILRDLVPAGCTAVDVGANRGIYSYALSRVAGAVEAFEPNPDLAGFAAAMLGKRARSATLHVPRTEKGAALHLLGNLGDVYATPERLGLAVRLATLDQFGFQNVGFIKIDVEGSEMDVIEGAKDTIARQRPTLLVELLAGTHDEPLQRIDEIKRTFGYDAWIVDRRAKRDAHQAVRAGGLTTRNVVFTAKAR
jgi:FkbM family methyltransferase